MKAALTFNGLFPLTVSLPPSIIIDYEVSTMLFSLDKENEAKEGLLRNTNECEPRERKGR